MAGIANVLWGVANMVRGVATITASGVLGAASLGSLTVPMVAGAGFGATQIVAGAAKVAKGIHQFTYGTGQACQVDCGVGGNLRKFAWGTVPLAPTLTEGLGTLDRPWAPQGVEDWYNGISQDFDSTVAGPLSSYLEGPRSEISTGTVWDRSPVADLYNAMADNPLIPPQAYRDDFNNWYDHLGSLW